jgi:hypothetical protein
MKYNDGQIHEDLYQKTDEEKRSIAHEFSEGNELLENALLDLWSRGIETSGCCNGHPEKNQNLSYISIKLDNNSSYLISKIVDLVKEDGLPDMSISFMSRDFDNIVANITITEKTKNFIFSKISELSKQNEIYKHDNEYIEHTKYLAKFADVNILNFRYAISNSQDMLGFYNIGSIIDFSDPALDLNDEIEEIKKSGSIKNVPYKCDNESINSLLQIIFPDDEYLRREERNRKR